MAGLPPTDLGSHTILLMQAESNAASRTFFDYFKVGDMITDMIRKYEAKLRQLNRGSRALSYSLQDIYDWIDAFPDLSVLIFMPNTESYHPFGKDFIKKKVHNQMKRDARQAARS